MSKLGTYKVSGIPLADKITWGDALFVLSVDGVNEITSYGSKPDRALATIDYAINNSASGDTIYVLEGHRETINSSAGLIPDVPKLSIIGVGNKNNRPVISLSTSGANETRIGITGANTLISNITFRANSTSVGSSSVGIAINANDVMLSNCRFDHTSTKTYFANTIEVLAGIDRTIISNCQFINFGTTGQSARAINLTSTGSTQIGTSIDNCIFTGNWSRAVIMGTSESSFNNLFIGNNTIRQNSTEASDPCIDVNSTKVLENAGLITHNFIATSATGVTTTSGIVVGKGFSLSRNYVNISSSLSGSGGITT